MSEYINGKTALALGAGVLAGGLVYLLVSSKVKRTKPVTNNPGIVIPNKRVITELDIESAIGAARLNKEEEASFRKALRLLGEDDEDSLEEGVKIIQKLTNQKKTLNCIRICGALEKLLIVLSKDFDNENLNRRLLQALANLVTIRENRLLFDMNDLKALVRKLESENDDILEATLRTLMNITVQREYEDKVREANGLLPIIDIMRTEGCSDAVRLQAARLLVNLVWNSKNKFEMIEHGLVERVLDILVKRPPEQLAIRLIRLVGFFSVNTDVATYKMTASETCADILVALMKRYKTSVNLAEAVAITVSKITVPRDAPMREALETFKKTFLAAEEGLGVEYLVALLKSEKSAHRYNALCSLGNLARESDAAVDKIKAQRGAAQQIKLLCSAEDSKTRDRATELLAFLSRETLD